MSPNGVTEAARAEGLLAGPGGLHGSVIRVGPAVLVGEAAVAAALARPGCACRRVGA